MGDRGSRRKKLVAVAIGFLPILLLEVSLRIAGYGEDPLGRVDDIGAMFVRDGPRMVVAPERSRQIGTRPFLLEKPAATTRIFVVGDSGVFGFNPLRSQSGYGDPTVIAEPSPALLEKRLIERSGGKSFEVLNCGVCGFGTTRLAPVVREVCGYSPDAVVFLGGSSDFLESRLFENWAKMRAAGLGALKNVRVVTLARNLLWPRRSRPPAADDGFDFRSPWLPVLDSDVIRGTREREELMARSAANLAEMVASCREAGVPLVLCTVPSHLRRPPQAYPDYSPDVQRVLLGDRPAEEVAGFNRALIEGRRLVENGDYEEALALLEPAIARYGDDPRISGLHFRLAEALSGLERFDRARREYRIARDLDLFLWRVTGPFNDTVRRLAREEGVTLADVEGAFERAVPDGIPDGRLFYDHNHPRPAGHALVAEEVEQVLVAPDGPLDEDR